MNREVLAGLALCAGCAGPSRSPVVHAATPWPEADALFRRDPGWRGGDAAYSVDLGGGRTLWLFGDSFVARPGSEGRAGCAMVRNSIGVQVGADPATAAMTFHWRGTRARPESWFAEDGDVWHWPVGGLRTGDRALVFCTRVCASGEGGPFGFRAVGWAAFVLRGLDGPATTWSCAPLPAFATPFDVVVGTAVLEHAEHVYAYCLAEPGNHAVYLVRWPRARFAVGDVRAPQWADGGRWIEHAALAGTPAPVLAEGAPEFSVSRARDGFVMVQSLGFGATDLAVRTAPAPEGPWSAPVAVFRPPESLREGVLVYAGKAHPQLACAGLAATYASNAWDFARLVRDETLYYPRFVRLPRCAGQ